MNMLRDLFEVPEPGPYLLCHSVGCLPRAARGEIDQALFAPWASQGSDGWPDWLAAIQRFRAALANLLNGFTDEFCPQPSVSAGLVSLLSGLPRFKGRDTLLASAHSFPSMGFAMKQCERLNYRLELLPEACDPGDPRTWEASISERVAAVVAMHVHSNTGVIAPVEEICRRARDCGVVSIIDICQSAGVMPLDLKLWNADAVIGSCVKWLCGGPGAAFLWVRRDLISSMEPLSVGWFSHADPFAFDIRDFRYADDAKRFWGGTPSIAPYVIASQGIATIAKITVDNLRRHNRSLISLVATTANIAIDMRGRGGTLCLTCTDVDALAAKLTKAKARYDRRERAVRLSFHVWNTDEEAHMIGSALRTSDVSLVPAWS